VKKLSITAFFIMLTLSLGLISINSTHLVKAQKSIVYQNGNAEGGQGTKQAQASSEDNKVLPVMSSSLSRLNNFCQNQEIFEILKRLCNLDVGGEGESSDSYVKVRFNFDVVKGFDKGPLSYAIANLDGTAGSFGGIANNPHSVEPFMYPGGAEVAILSPNGQVVGVDISSNFICMPALFSVNYCFGVIGSNTGQVYDIKITQGE
jgi:hypothetical protein